MGEEDLIAAIKNALERGETIEEAKLSLLNAGYTRSDVGKAAKQISKLRTKKNIIPRPKQKTEFPVPPTYES